MMYSEERRTKILDSLNLTGRTDVCELAVSFHVSKETIRRDLHSLESEGRILRTHGGAILPPTDSQTKETVEPPATVRTTQNIAEKKAICKFAAGKIKNGDVIFVDNSTTCIYLYQYIPRDMQVTILTNSLSFLIECSKSLCPTHTVICLGGILKSTNLSVYGNVALQNARQYFPNKAFISCTGIISDSQITDSGVQEIDIKRSLIATSQEVFLLADHTKFKPVGPVFLGGFSDIDYLITDIKSDFTYLNLTESFMRKILITK